MNSEHTISHSSEAQAQEIGINLTHFLVQIQSGHVRTRDHEPVPLHFDSKKDALVPFPWPVDRSTGQRLPPSGFESHRRTHEFQYPCCLCAVTEGTEYTESRIGVVESLTQDLTRNQSILNGEFAAVCAKQACGYFLCLERFYPIRGLKLQVCRARSTPQLHQALGHTVDVDRSFRAGDGLFQVMTDAVIRGNRPRALQVVRPKKKVEAAVVRGLAKGLSEERFWATFVQCLLCKNVIFRETFAANHSCDIEEPAGRRYHPYVPPPTTYSSTRGRIAAARLQRTYAFVMSSSPTPTEPATERDDDNLTQASDSTMDQGYDGGASDVDASDLDHGEEAQEPGFESEEVVTVADASIPDLDSEYELPTVLEIMRGTHRGSRSEVGGAN